MPIQDYWCRDCNRVYEFLYPTSDDPRQPRCPRCGAVGLERRMAQFAFVRGGKNPLAAIPKLSDDEAAATTPPDGTTPERDPGLYKLWEHSDDPGARPGEAMPRPRRRLRVTETGEQAPRDPER
ncbi:MAG: zinc ribbon domain-containing protein [Caldilineae bacterium]|nr:zinc ribbon domain-containing protein [Chloroflexota bacterium]MCB9176713.1 zinc ribbon domain-containing protein [Caldilineae bacterium]